MVGNKIGLGQFFVRMGEEIRRRTLKKDEDKVIRSSFIDEKNFREKMKGRRA